MAKEKEPRLKLWVPNSKRISRRIYFDSGHDKEIFETYMEESEEIAVHSPDPVDGHDWVLVFEEGKHYPGIKKIPHSQEKLIKRDLAEELEAYLVSELQKTTIAEVTFQEAAGIARQPKPAQDNPARKRKKAG